MKKLHYAMEKVEWIEYNTCRTKRKLLKERTMIQYQERTYQRKCVPTTKRQSKYSWKFSTNGFYSGLKTINQFKLWKVRGRICLTFFTLINHTAFDDRKTNSKKVHILNSNRTKTQKQCWAIENANNFQLTANITLPEIVYNSSCLVAI